MEWLDDINALLEESFSLIESLEELHDQALEDSEVRRRFKARVKNVLEHERSVLDYLAVGLTEDFGTPKRRGFTYYPFAQADSGFPSLMEENMPGVAAARPEIANAIRNYQPYQRGRGETLRTLNQLTREQKHNRLSFQIVRQVYWCEATERATGRTLYWEGLRFEPQQMVSGSGGYFKYPDRGAQDSPKPFAFGGPTGFLIFGVEIDFSTQAPYPDQRLEVNSGLVDQWCFVKPYTPVMYALSDGHSLVTEICNKVVQASGL